MIRFTRHDLQDANSALDREWLETNGLGGYASSTILGINTRKYHGLLVAAVTPPVERLLMLSHLDETLIINGARLEIASNEYEGLIHPDGYRYLEEVWLDPYPIFTYVVGGVKLEKSIFMLHGENTTCVTYAIHPLPNGPRVSQVFLEVRPIIGFRGHHALMKEDGSLQNRFDVLRGSLVLRPLENMPALNISFTGGRFEQSGCWYRNYHYRREKESGYPWREDLFSPGRFVFTFEDSDSVWLAFSTQPDRITEVASRQEAEVERRHHLTASPQGLDELAEYLQLAADAFITRRGGDGASIIAGYPWFTDWGRDTMISLPGLTLVTGRFQEARSIISTFLEAMKDGLIPNRFPDSSGEAEYNSMDATLWLFEAVRKYYDYTGDSDFIAEILPKLREAIAWHLEGTMYGIKVDEDGLLAGGQEGTQLTWMDAKVRGKVITARIGKPVEVNALWYNALRIVANLCLEFGGLAEEGKYDHLARRASENFNKAFWNMSKQCLFDLVTGDHRDEAVRPNQVLAISLTYPVLETSRWSRVLQVVERELLTPFGLRSLSPTHPDYRGTYAGDLETRDHAYHQGTIWPWLLGPYITAYVKTHGKNEATRAYCRSLLDPFLRHLKDAGLGTISEIFDGDPPHRPNGCIAQAWSVAELLRAILEDLTPKPIGPNHLATLQTTPNRGQS
jgi:predicted glycogen debranching enzyme